ncbi:MAG: hypothetical protein BWZ10_02596 [candidate division BRC1 bacterium ADurb.BinA364]|nr:MAG: hypothetical protein BWZ10_02596 [candidate division BRC1 bacterium ADurb.BinA364]
MAAFELRTFRASHAGVPALPGCARRRAPANACAAGRAVVGHENQNRVFGQAPFLQAGHQAADVFVDVLDHAVELGHRFRHAAFDVGLAVFFGDIQRTVRRVGRNIGEERPVFVSLDELQGRPEKHVGAVAPIGLPLAVVAQHVVEVIVAPVVRTLADSAAAMDQDLLEAAILRTERIIVAQVPLAEDSRAIARRGKNIGHGRFAGLQHRAPHDGVPNADARRIAPGHQRRACRRARRIDMEIGQPKTLAVQAVQIRSADHGVAVAAQVAVALVVGHHQHDIGLSNNGGERGRRACQAQSGGSGGAA